MPIGVTTTTVVNIAAATGSINADVSNSDNYHCHRFFFSISAAATVQVQGSHDGSAFFDLLDSAVTTDGEVRELDRPWTHLRVKVTGNTGDTTVTVQQFYGNMAGTV